ncbi:VTT domain-containing protein [Glutamicibacter sp. JL.03c]|uniref:DedA family protein n=1 Tax=Glutamicibacter sp. JL.03c TaxID=2984842 RepID=UPI0021F7C737|nr:VTT domain-containing protein [Glutamicibacter sp. JL.03c]UYQ76976.1 VTT domain-containing protein [Glutamicibacter sp. JL.03c]
MIIAESISWLINDAPFGVTFIFFFLGAFARGNATYWVGRGLAKGVEHTRFQKHLHGPVYRRAQKFIGRWGLFAIPLSFLTLGIQSAVNASAGISRMPLRRYLPAVAVGALLWSTIYTTVGLAVFYAWLALDWPWVAGGLALIGVVVLIVLRRRARTRSAQESAPPESSEINC